jgi:hypothetical protein
MDRRAEIDVDEVLCLDCEQKVFDDEATACETRRGRRQDVGLHPVAVEGSALP